MSLYFKASNFNNLYYKTCKKLLENPEHVITNRKGDKIHELINPTLILLNPHNCFATIRDLSLKYLEGELEFYFSGSPFLKDITKHSKFWEHVTDDGRTVNSNYGKMLFHDRNYHNYTQFEYARDMLIQNIESKKAVMTIYTNENAHPSQDNPCTMYLQFFVRECKLDLYVKMRSSDIYFGMPYDVPFFVLVQIIMVEILNSSGRAVSLGKYVHQSGSLHMYERNFEGVQKYVDNFKTFKLEAKAQRNLFTKILYPWRDKLLKEIIK